MAQKLIRMRLSAAEAAQRLMAGYSPPSTDEDRPIELVKIPSRSAANTQKRAVDESDYDDEAAETESENFVTRGGILGDTNGFNDPGERPTEKKYGMAEIREPELQNLFLLSQNVFDQQEAERTIEGQDQNGLNFANCA